MGRDDAYFVDCGITDTSASTTISGLGHLVGETVAVLGDGIDLGTFTVSAGGTITLLAAVTTAQVGLAYTSTLKPSKLDIEGMGIALTKKITRAIISFFETLGGEFGANTSNMDSVPYEDTSLFTGTVVVPFEGGYEREGDIIIRQTQPMPMTTRGLVLPLGVYDR